MRSSFALSSALCVHLLLSCGKNADQGRKTLARPRILEEQASEGLYRSPLRPLNNHLSGFIPTGMAEISVRGDVVVVKTLLDDDARVAHRQSILLGTRCPTLSDDTDRNGVIDVAEATRASGTTFIPLDGDLTSAALGAGVYPVGRGFTYVERASLQDLEADARARTGQNLNLAGRVILVHGVSAETPLPETVATLDASPRQATVPVACGILKRLE